MALDPQHRIFPEMTRRARRLRRETTFPERMLWGSLRGRRFGNIKFRRQHVIGPYVVDFICADTGLVIELDGDSHRTSAVEDLRREKYLKGRGMKIIRFFNDDVLRDIDGVLRAIENALAVFRSEEKHPHPNPLP